MAQQNKKTKTSHPRKIVVGVDFGTTFSGVAWGHTSDGLINIIQQWPGLSSPLDKSSDKVPTHILYDEKAPNGFKWGYQIEDSLPRHHWFKLDLESTYNRSTPLSNHYLHPKHLLPDVKHNAKQLTSDYLGALKMHLLFILQIQLGGNQAKETHLQFVLTVPAVWSDAAKEKTLAAAKDAGLGDDAPILMVSEPEAAATYALQRQELNHLSRGDTFVVCDAGGGTVDLISYTVVKLKPILEVKEAAPGKGALSGSTYLNREFQEYVVNKLGQQDGWDEDTLIGAMDHFDQMVKMEYTSTATDQTWRVPVIGLATNEALSVKKGRLILKSADVKNLFEPVLAEVVNLVLDQIRITKGDVKAILLVGGFGTSMYLRERIREAVSNEIEVLQPPYGLSAVVRGAVMKGLAQSNPRHAKVRLTSRIAKKQIGAEIWALFDKKIHSEHKKSFDAFAGKWRSTSMDWFIRKGDAVNEDIPVKFNKTRTSLVSDGRPNEIQSIIYCDRKNRPAVVYRDNEVVELVRLTVKIGDLPDEAFHIRVGADGEMWYKIDYCVEVTYQSASTKYDLVYEGKRYTSVTAEYV